MKTIYIIFIFLTCFTIVGIAYSESNLYYRNKANMLVDNKKYKQAIDAYTKSIERHPHRGDIIYDRGNTFYLMGEYQKAVDDFSLALSIDKSPKLAKVIYMTRGYTYLIKLNNKKGCNDLIKLCNMGVCGLYEKAKNQGLCE